MSVLTIGEGKSLLRIVGESSAISFGSNLISKFAAIASTVIILRYVSVYDYGIWQLSLAVIGFIGVTTLPSLGNVFVADLSRELGREREEVYGAILFKMSLLLMILGPFAAAILFFIAPFVTLSTGINFTLILRVLSLYFIFISLQRIYSIAFQSRLDFFSYQGMKIVNRMSYLLLIGFFIVYLGMGIEGIVYAYTFSLLPVVFFYFPAFLKIASSLSVGAVAEFSLLDFFRAHGKWALLYDYAEGFLHSLRPWIIGYFLGVEAVALIALAIALFGEIIVFLPLNQVLAPIIPTKIDDRENFKFIFERGTKYSLWFFTIIGILAFISAPYIVGILFPRYIPALPLFNLLLLSLPIYPFLIMSERTFYAAKSQKDLLISTSASKLLSIIGLLPLFIRFLGIAGAITERIFSDFFVGLLRLRLLLGKDLIRPVRLLGLVRFDEYDKLLLGRILNAAFRIKLDKSKSAR